MSTHDAQHLRLLEAVLFANAEPMTEHALAGRLPEEADLPALLDELKATYAERGVNLVQAGKSWAFRTAPDVATQLSRYREVARKLSRAAVETLAIISYHQPVTRAEIEEVRGVSLSKGTLDQLFEEGWIKPRGKRRTPGRPVTWGTTDGFLDHFGLESLKDLPGMDELKAAGLLDSRPAIEAYSIRGKMKPIGGVDADNGEDAVGGEGDDAMEDLIGEESEQELVEPLNPDDDDTHSGEQP